VNVLGLLKDADPGPAELTLRTFLVSQKVVGRAKVTTAIAWVNTIKSTFTKELELTNKSKGYLLLAAMLLNAEQVKDFLARNVTIAQNYPVSVSNPFHLQIVINLWNKRSGGSSERVFTLWTAYGNRE
jgi:hypothetical protein